RFGRIFPRLSASDRRTFDPDGCCRLRSNRNGRHRGSGTGQDDHQHRAALDTMILTAVYLLLLTGRIELRDSRPPQGSDGYVPENLNPERVEKQIFTPAGMGRKRTLAQAEQKTFFGCAARQRK